MNIPQDWLDIAPDAFGRLYQNTILPVILDDIYERELEVYPNSQKRFRAFKECPYKEVKVVILGQDPYHTPGAANGLCFDVDGMYKAPPSLLNICKEMDEDVPIDPQEAVDNLVSKGSNLGHLPGQGVLMLNTALSVLEGSPGSHINLWKPFTEQIIAALNRKDNVVWLLWGNYAKAYTTQITNPTHRIIKSAHPSPLARKGFRHSKPFSRCNAALKEMGHTSISW